MTLIAKIAISRAFQERIALKPIEIDVEKLHMKFLALNFDFEGPSLDFLCSRKPAYMTRASKSGTSIKVVFLPLLVSLSRKQLQITWACCLSQQALVTSFSVVSTSMTLQFLAAAHTPRMNCNEMAGDRLTVCEQVLL